MTGRNPSEIVVKNSITIERSLFVISHYLLFFIRYFELFAIRYLVLHAQII